MIDLQLSDPPNEVLRRLREFGADWRESKIPAELRHAGVLGAGVAVNADQFTMTIRGRRSPNLQLHGIVAATSDGGSRVSGALQLSRANQMMMVGGVVLIGSILWASSGVITAVVACLALIAVVIGLRVAGRTLAEREYQTLLEHAVGSYEPVA